jgi:AraC-like DNA-binding protein
MLEDSAMEIVQIAASLNYANASAFTRAFQRWSGTTPARWRVTNKRAAQEARRNSARRATGSKLARQIRDAD